MICQMLFNNNIVHESLKVIQMNNSGCQEHLVIWVIVLRRLFSKSLFFFKQKIWTFLKTMFLVSENSWRDLHVESLIQNLWNIFFSINLTFASTRLNSQNPCFFQRKTMIFPNTAVYMWMPHVRSDWSNWPIKSHVGIWYALTCKQHGRGFPNLHILLKIAKKLQIGKDYDKKEYEYQKYIDYALKGYQHYGK